jgi:transcriptional regulator with XRE-family HTH domain
MILFMTIKGKIGEWIWNKYLEQMESGYKSQAEFARELGIDEKVLNHYINGRRLPTGENIDRLATLGYEIYDLLGLVRPDPKTQALLKVFYNSDPETQDAIIEFALRQIGMEPVTGSK